MTKFTINDNNEIVEFSENKKKEIFTIHFFNEGEDINKIINTTPIQFYNEKDFKQFLSDPIFLIEISKNLAEGKSIVIRKLEVYI
jgi:hypothetical protein